MDAVCVSVVVQVSLSLSTLVSLTLFALASTLRAFLSPSFATVQLAYLCCLLCSLLYAPTFLSSSLVPCRFAFRYLLLLSIFSCAASLICRCCSSLLAALFLPSVVSFFRISSFCSLSRSCCVFDKPSLVRLCFSD